MYVLFIWFGGHILGKRVGFYIVRVSNKMNPRFIDYPIVQAFYTQGCNSMVARTCDYSTTTLAQLDKLPVSRYLNELVPGLKDFLKCIITPTEDFAQTSTTQQPSMKEALMLLFEVLYQSNKLLQNVQHRLVCPPDMNGEDIHSLRQLQKCLSEFTYFLDQIMIYYSDTSIVTELPLLEEVRIYMAEMHKYLNLVKSHPCIEIGTSTQVNQEEVICLVLGLQSSLANRLANLNPGIRYHQSDTYFLLIFLAENCENDGKLTIEEGLKKIGFTENRSKAIAGWITKQPLCQHQSLLTWTELYIETVFKYSVFLSKCVTQYPYKKDILQEWFEVSIPWDCVSEDTASSMDRKVTLINTLPQLASEVIRMKENQTGSCLWFHATDHKAVVSIVEDGINLGAGGFKRDFSHGYGFYLTSDCEHAITWARKIKAGAVILFKISNMLTRFQCLDLTSDQLTWEHIVKFNRRGKRRGERPSKDLNDKYRRCDYILGPLCWNGVESNEESWQPLGFENGRPQLCVRSESMAEYIGNRKNIFGIVFMNSP